MLALLTRRIAEAYVDPRRSARRILDAKPSVGDALTMVLAAVAIGGVVEIGLSFLFSPEEPLIGAPPEQSGPPEETVEVNFIDHVFANAILSVSQFLIVGTLAWAIGRQAGGAAERAEVFAVVGWHTLAAVPLSLLLAVALLLSLNGNPVATIFMIAGLLYLVYLLAAFIAEAHRFENVGLVFASIFGVAFSVVFVLSIIASVIGVEVNA